jgi:hypothetical protein
VDGGKYHSSKNVDYGFIRRVRYYYYFYFFCSKQLLPDGQIYGPKQMQKERYPSLNKIGHN